MTPAIALSITVFLASWCAGMFIVMTRPATDGNIIAFLAVFFVNVSSFILAVANLRP